VNSYAFAVGEEPKDGAFLLYGFGTARKNDKGWRRPCDQVFALRLPAAAGRALNVSIELDFQDPDQEIVLTAGETRLGTLKAADNPHGEQAFTIPADAPRSGGWVTITARAATDPHRPPARRISAGRVTFATGDGSDLVLPDEVLNDRIKMPPFRMVDMFRQYQELRKRAAVDGHRADEYEYSGDMKTFFGDVHVHTEYSNCGRPFNRSIDENVRAARDRGHDFIAVADHAEHMTEDSWRRYFTDIREAGEKHGILTIPAFEWTSLEIGHRNIYFRSEEVPPYFSSRTQQTNHTRKLRRFFDDNGISAFAAAHHPAAIEHLTDLDTIDESVEPLIEIFSTWGNSECYGAPNQRTATNLPGSYVQDALARGHKLGFLGGGDVHNTLPGDGGLTAVIAEELTLESLYRAMLARRCYATSGDRILIDFYLNGFPMGSIFNVNQYSINRLFPINLSASVVCPERLRSIEVISNGEIVYDCDLVECRTETDMFLSYEKLQTPSLREGSPRSHLANNSRYYYLRVTQQDDGMAWSSPVWIDYRYGWSGEDCG